MARPLIQKQIDAVDEAIREYPELQKPLALHRAVLKIREPVELSSTKGTNIRWNGELPKDLQQHLYSKKEPALKFLSASVFNTETARQVCQKIIQTLSSQGIGGKGLPKVSKALKDGEVKITDALEAVIEDNTEWFNEQGQKFGVDPALLHFLFGIPIQPCLEEIARKMDPAFLEQWWEPQCPGCGRIPQIAKFQEKKRYLACSFCGTEYLADMFLCVKCGNKEPYTLGYLKPKDQPGIQIDFCEQCNHFIKVIDRGKLAKTIPRGLEDILTHNLDKIVLEVLFKTGNNNKK